MTGRDNDASWWTSRRRQAIADQAIGSALGTLAAALTIALVGTALGFITELTWNQLVALVIALAVALLAIVWFVRTSQRPMTDDEVDARLKRLALVLSVMSRDHANGSDTAEDGS